MTGYRLEDFSVGESFELEHDGAAHRLELIKAEELPGSGREGGGFRLEFRGPFEPILPQAIHSLRTAGTEARDIFIVPIGREAEGTRYEAVFY
jgi:hypothetical protein